MSTGFSTKEERMAAIPFALGDILGGKQLSFRHGKIVISKDDIEDAVLEELRRRLKQWRFSIEENEEELYAIP